jgi:hypothetical protein
MKRKARETYTRAQVEQHTELSLHLQHTNARATHLVLRLARLRPSHPHFKSLCAELAFLAELITLDISLCEGIANNVSQPFQRIIVTFQTACDFCEENPDLNSPEKDAEYLGFMTTSSTWGIQLDSLTRLIMRICHDISGNSPYPARETKKFIRCVNVLYTAVQRQSRHLARIGAQNTPGIEVRSDSSEVCPRCGQTYEGEILDDDHTNGMSEDKI